MSLDDSIRKAAERNGVQQQFWDIFGKSHATAPDTNRAIVEAIGLDCSSEQALARSLANRDEEDLRRVLPPVVVAGIAAPIRIPVHLPRDVNRLHLTLQREDGTGRSFDLDLAGQTTIRTAMVGGVEYTERIVELPGMLPPGYHTVRVEETAMSLIVAPEAAHAPPPGRHAGLGVTLYGLRSHRNWGCGDFRDLRDLIDWAIAELHASFIALNPLHAIHNRTPYNASPYLPNSIYYRNFLYLDVEGIPGYEELPEFRLEAAELRATTHVEYERVAALKRRALERIFHANPPSRECRQWIESEGDLLRLFATYCALDEHLHAKNPELWVWPDWPEQFRDPSNPAVAKFAAEHAETVLFHGWLQWLIDRQIGEVQQHALRSGMSIGLYHDLALATDRCGSDLWAHREFYVNGARVGSPPDDFSPTGQDWSFPPPSQRRHLQDSYRLFAQSIRNSMRHGGALRIDHVMRLFRLYWIPEGHDATRGAYVKDRAEDLVRILALESVRNRAFIVGEDLGTVETEVRQALSAAGILSYRLLIFERTEQGFRKPGQYPAQALTATTTHDLPTIAGFWQGEDIEARLKAGTIGHDSYRKQLQERARDKQHLLDNLFAEKLLPHHFERDASRIHHLDGHVHNAVAGYLAGTPCALWLVNQEDMTRELHQQNLPGTTGEYRNWSLKMKWTLEELRELRQAKDSTAMFRHWITRTGRNH